MSKASDAKKARRKKRQSARNAAWLPANIIDELEIAAELEGFDARLTERGWMFGEQTDDGTGVYWIWPPSVTDVDHEAERADATVILLSPDEGGEIAHVVFVGGDEDYQFNLDELFEHLDAIEAYRMGGALPDFAETEATQAPSRTFPA